MMYRIGFIVEQALGHITHTKNLQQNVPSDLSVEGYWGLVPFETKGVAARIPVYKSNWTVRAGLRARRVVAQLMGQRPLDVLFFHTQVPAVLARKWVERVPSVISLDATPLQYDRLGAAYDHRRGPLWLEIQKWRLNRECFRAAQHLVTWSHWAKQGLIADYEVPADKITVIPPGVNVTDWMRPQPRVPHKGPVKILFVGGNLERKGGLLLLEAYRALRSLDIELHLVTKDAVANEPGVYTYNNLQPNSSALKRLYHECDLFCLPTYGDCLPMVLSEAGAAGLPSITTAVAAIPEIVRDGETGLLVPPGDVAALTAALRTLVENPVLRLRQGQRAVHTVSQDYDAPQNAHRLLALLKQVVDNARPGGLTT